MAGPGRRRTHLVIPSALKPPLRAYLLAYAYSVTPKAISLLAALVLRKQIVADVLLKLRQVLWRASALNRFPAFCAVVIGGSTLLRTFVAFVLPRTFRYGGSRSRRRVIERLIRLFSSFLAAALGFALLNSRRGESASSESIASEQVKSLDTTDESTQADNHDAASTHKRRQSYPIADQAMSSHSLQPQSIALAGKTLDLTLFALIRALDVIIPAVWSSRIRERLTIVPLKRLEPVIASLADPFIFAFSSSIIMWSWFYKPHRLPHSYTSWISSVAQIDRRLIEALRQARYGNFVYGKDTDMAPLLGEMCKEYGMPEEWGDPAKTVPIPCELYHMGTGPSCEWHAATRFARAWWLALKLYLPLNLVVLLRRKRLSKAHVLRSLLDAGRSSAFLGAFVGLFYLSVCLARTRVGPKVFSRKTITPMMWDSGLCVAAGCLTCGWSILVEKPSRRQEIALFVAPRAATTVLPRRYDRKYLWREHLIFALSAAVVLAVAQEKPQRVRGVLGRILHQVLRQD